MALGFAGLGYAAQRALVMAKKVAPTQEAAAVEAAKVEACVAKVVDTPYITEPASSVSSVQRDDLVKGKEATDRLVKDSAAEQNGHGHAANGTVNGYRQPEVPLCALCLPCMLLHSVLMQQSLSES